MPSRVLECVAACVLLAAPAMAQSIVATNWTSSGRTGTNDTQLTISRNDEMVPLAPVLPLTPQAANDIPPIGLSGQIYRADPANQLGLDSSLVAFISCDNSDYPGNIDQADVFGTAASKNATAVLFYSQQADYCAMNGTAVDGSAYPWVFSMKYRQDTESLLETLNTNQGKEASYIAIGTMSARDANSSNGTGPNGGDESSQQPNHNALDHSPSTAIAMIILYSITGVITALFLMVIITGAVRAHRHPERYGPRTVLGLPRQSRARGLGRAILDTIPIVKFGEREQPKPTDVELGNHANGIGAREVREGSTATDNRQEGAARAAVETSEQQRTEDEPRPSNAEEGISAALPGAAATTEAGLHSSPEQPGCSICTEDFEVGQDQRVLPCDHRFHPECVDPWLLNVSSTCPLCRVDLRPQTSRTSGTSEVDEHGNPIPSADGAGDDVDALPPPLGAASDDNRRSSVRQSLRQSILGIGRPDRMTREERVLALRQYRHRQAVRRRHSVASQAENEGSAGETAATAATTAEGGSSGGAGTRNRLSRLFGGRNRGSAVMEEQAQPGDGDQGGGAESERDGAQR